LTNKPVILHLPDTSIAGNLDEFVHDGRILLPSGLPAAMNRRLNEAVGQILKLNREKSIVKKAPVRRMVRPR
jgi:hypothetical protein